MKIRKKITIYKEELSNIQNCEIGENCKIHSHVWIGSDVVIGNNVKIQAFTFIPNGVTIEDDCFIGPNVVFVNDLHPPSGKDKWIKINVGKGTSIGASAVIMASIGNNSMIGAGSVVDEDVPSNEVWKSERAKYYKPINKIQR